MHLYAEAETYADEQLYRLQNSADTINNQYLNMLRLQAQAQQQLGYTKEANTLYMRALTLTDSLSIRQQKQALMEFSVINQLQEYKNTINRQKEQLRIHRHFTILSIIIIILGTTTIILALFHIRRQRKYNQSLFARIREQQKAEEELQRLRTLAQSRTIPDSAGNTPLETIPEKSADETLHRLDSWLNEDNRYLYKDITADEAAHQCHIEKRELNNLLLKYHEKNFTDYLIEKRLNYACNRLLEPGYATVETIAYESGFNSLRTFLRRFKEQYNLSPTEWRNNAVALLMHDAGFAACMSYEPEGSEAFETDILTAMVENFCYAPTIQYVYRKDFTTDEWIQIIREELANKRPIFFGGYDLPRIGGHFFICDGIDAADYLHINWGWVGTYDGYFNIEYIYPTRDEFNKLGLSHDMSMIIGIQPQKNQLP